ncbi:hypothetical protein BV20DRAFT_967066 [Pilatotrama ljubarskyi]|nr:hypothetical protein BV20DRAFT_967066 [Pilatotrama ljubarskyi]
MDGQFMWRSPSEKSHSMAEVVTMSAGTPLLPSLLPSYSMLILRCRAFPLRTHRDIQTSSHSTLALVQHPRTKTRRARVPDHRARGGGARTTSRPCTRSSSRSHPHSRPAASFARPRQRRPVRSRVELPRGESDARRDHGAARPARELAETTRDRAESDAVCGGGGSAAQV